MKRRGLVAVPAGGRTGPGRGQGRPGWVPPPSSPGPGPQASGRLSPPGGLTPIKKVNTPWVKGHPKSGHTLDDPPPPILSPSDTSGFCDPLNRWTADYFPWTSQDAPCPTIIIPSLAVLTIHVCPDKINEPLFSTVFSPENTCNTRSLNWAGWVGGVKGLSLWGGLSPSSEGASPPPPPGCQCRKVSARYYTIILYKPNYYIIYKPSRRIPIS